MSVTLKDVAKAAGVSASTVSRVLSGDARISEKTRERVMECVKTLDYKLNPIARGLKTNRTYTVGFLAPEITNAFFMGVAQGVEDELRKSGYSLLIAGTGDSRQGEAESVRLMAERSVDGLILIPCSHEGRHIRDAQDKRMPIVVADRLAEGLTADAVLVDNVNGTYAAIEHLIGNGHRRIGFIGGDLRLTPAKERYDGYRRALKDYLIPIEEELVKFGDFHDESGYRLAKELMEQPAPPEYIFVANYYMNLGAMRYFVETSGRSSAAAKLASFDDMELSSVLGLSGVRIRQPVREIGSRAAKLLLERIQGDPPPHPQIVRLKTTLVTGG